MFAGSQRFETGYCKNCKKTMLLIRRGLGYEWRCKECGTECNTTHKVELDKSINEGCSLKACAIISTILGFLAMCSHNPHGPDVKPEAYILWFIIGPFALWLFVRILSGLSK